MFLQLPYTWNFKKVSRYIYKIFFKYFIIDPLLILENSINLIYTIRVILISGATWELTTQKLVWDCNAAKFGQEQNSPQNTFQCWQALSKALWKSCKSMNTLIYNQLEIKRPQMTHILFK